jgi:hypothetical protein
MNTKTETEMSAERPGNDSNPDPITGAPGSHAIGTAIGSASGAATGALFGAVGGPIGAAVGGVIGAIAGAVAGHGVAEEIDPTEDAHWKENYDKQPHYKPDYHFADYQPALRLGYMAARRKPDTSFVDHETELQSSWDKVRGESRLDWEDAKHATEAAWDRVDKMRTRSNYDDAMTTHL